MMEQSTNVGIRMFFFSVSVVCGVCAEFAFCSDLFVATLCEFSHELNLLICKSLVSHSLALTCYGHCDNNNIFSMHTVTSASI